MEEKISFVHRSRAAASARGLKRNASGAVLSFFSFAVLQSEVMFCGVWWLVSGDMLSNRTLLRLVRNMHVPRFNSQYFSLTFF